MLSAFQWNFIATVNIYDLQEKRQLDYRFVLKLYDLNRKNQQIANRKKNWNFKLEIEKKTTELEFFYNFPIWFVKPNKLTKKWDLKRKNWLELIELDEKLILN